MMEEPKTLTVISPGPEPLMLAPSGALTGLKSIARLRSVPNDISKINVYYYNIKELLLGIVVSRPAPS